MAAKTIGIEFDGYWRDVNKGSVPDKSGIYCVYECTHNAPEKTVTLHRLIYIGESEDVRARLANHEKYPDWSRYVRQGNTLCFSFGAVGAVDRERAEAALIVKHNPPVNTEYINAFPFDQTTMALAGEIQSLHANFTVVRT